MQIGQILVEQRWVAPEALAQAIAEQRHTGKRICSLLIARGLLDPDHASRALSTQHNVPGVLQKHIENRDRQLADLLPAAVARACFALPIGRTRSQALIVCVRDPRPELTEVLATAVGGPVVIAVAPAHQLEQLIKLTYAGVPSRVRTGEVSFEVDLSTRPIATMRDEAVIARHLRTSDEVEVDLHTRQIAVVGDGLGDLGSMTLVGLDDVRVTKDPSQSGKQSAALPRTSTTQFPPPVRTTAGQHPPGRMASASPLPPRTTSGASIPPPRTMTVPGLAPARTSTVPPRGSATSAPMATPSLDATIAALDRATLHGDATELALQYLSGRFHHAVLFTISDGAALGARGHGGQLTDESIRAITVPLSAPSIVQVAHDSGRLATAAPADAGAIQDRLVRTLGNPHAFAAIPVEVDAGVAYVIAVGDPVAGAATADHDLERLGRVLGAAYQRLPR